MPARRIQKRPYRKTPIGDLRDLVQIHTVTTRPRRGAGAEKVFTPLAKRPMKVETLGQTRHGFNDVNIDEVPTHKITARYRADLTAEKFLEFRGSYFEILDIEDLEERRQELVMKCRVTGSTSKKASGA